MKVALVAPYFYPHVGGVETHVYYLAWELGRKGHDVLVLTSMFETNIPEEERMDGFKVKRVKPVAIPFKTPVVPNYGKALDEFAPDIIHAHTPPPLCSYYSMKWAKRKRVPYVLTHHCDLEIPSILGRLITGVYRRTLEKKTLSYSSRIIVTTKTYAQTSLSVWKYPCEVIPNAINVERFNPNVDGSRIKEKHGLENDRILMYVGRVLPHKGLKYFVESARYTPSDVKVLIVGGGDFRGDLERYAGQIGVRDKVIFAGRVSNKDLPEYYGAADVFVLPSISRLEAFGIVALEAMASGVPVAVSDIPGVREVIVPEENGLLFEPFNARSLADTVMRYLSDPELYRKIKENGRKYVEEKYPWPKVASQVENLYRKVLSENSTDPSVTKE